ncbi:MAG: sugar transferase [Dinoroseobacter sp.]|nr:sugar transferase [Dinoroseobacter sp.]
MVRFLELALVCIVLALSALPMAITALVVWASLGRPLMFSQLRCGKDGRPLEILKFRSMIDARDAKGELLPDAVRQTPVTRLLRRSRLDETPQLLTILKGDMAFVGPRPLLYESIARHGLIGVRRCTVRPGITGWAQISGNTALSEEDKLTLDLWYVAHRNTWLDLRILAETIKVLVVGERPHSGRLAQARSWLCANPIASEL